MKPKLIILTTLVSNLLLGNLLLFLMHGKYASLGEKLYVHGLTSIVALVLLFLLFKKISPSTKKYTLIILPIIFSCLVPLISVYVMFSLFGLIDGSDARDVLKGFFVAIPLAIISSMVSWFFWLPFGIMNTGFAHWYRAALRRLANKTMSSIQ